ncbi:MAG: 3'(2'),5'-bisphosphate nucleotidase CysQ [Acidimicrobiales bacterium]
MTITTTARDHETARSVADRAGRVLLALQQEMADASPRDRGAEGDRRSHDLILQELAATHPDDAVLSEEAASDDGRLTAERVWIVDPLDGSREYGEVRDDWAVHVALVVDGRPVAGAVALPGLDCVLSTGTAPPSPPPNNGRLRIVVSRTRPPTVAEAVADALGAELIPMGSAGAKAGAVILGEADAYIHAGGQYEWDSAAPVAVATAAGLHASRVDGIPLRYNQPNPWLPDLLICRPELAEPILSITRANS